MMLCVQWYAGNFVCKVLMMVRTGGFILSSNMLVVLSIDRCTHIDNINSIDRCTHYATHRQNRQ